MSTAVLAPIAHTPAQEAAVIRKVLWRLIPFTVLLYVVNYIDRVNVSMAKFQMIDSVPGFTEGAFALGVSLFFIGYFLFEIPSNLIQEKVGPRRWMARIMISWGLISVCFMFSGITWTVNLFGQAFTLLRPPYTFYALRFLLGLAEAGFFPGMILYLSYWIPAEQRARAGAFFFTSTAIAGVIGNPLSGIILYLMNDVAPFHGWQWLFLIEGIPSVLLGCVVLVYLTDYPKDAKWLTADEREILTARMAHERHNHPSGHTAELRHAFANPRVWLLGLFYALNTFAFYAVTYWTPSIIKKSLVDAGIIVVTKVKPGEVPNPVPDLVTGLFSAIPFGFAVVGMILISLHSDRTRERRWHVAFSTTIGMTGLSIAALGPGLFQGNVATIFTIVGLSIGSVGIWAALGPFWTLPPQLLCGTAAAAGIALVNSLGNLGGGYCGPLALGELRALTGADTAGLLASATSLLCATIVVLSLRIDPHRLKNDDPCAESIDPTTDQT